MKLKVVGIILIVAGLVVTQSWLNAKRIRAVGAAIKSGRHAKQELQYVKERDKKIEEMIDNKFRIAARWDSQYADYVSPDDEDGSSAQQGQAQDGVLIGYVAVWGSVPGTVGSSEGMTVWLYGEDGSCYSGTIDSKNWYRIPAPVGNYKLVINEPGYKYFEKQVTVESGFETLANTIGLQNK
jgi:hypothetical protein